MKKYQSYPPTHTKDRKGVGSRGQCTIEFGDTGRIDTRVREKKDKLGIYHDS